MRRISLGSRLALLFAACTAAVSLGAGVLFTQSSEQHFIELDEQLLDTRLTQLREQLTGLQTQQQVVDRLPELRSQFNLQTDVALRISSGTGEAWFESRPGLPDANQSAQLKTLQAGEGLLASKIALQNKDLKTASMINNGTAQRFDEQTAATEALRGRMGEIDQYNVKGTTNVNFDTGKAVLSDQAKNDLCAAATSANGMSNALLLVVGYTDSTGGEELNQELSEKRASRVVNYLQQACGWKPYRMLTPTGMAEADPVASNDTIEGKAQNRRVAVNILVSKAVDGL